MTTTVTIDGFFGSLHHEPFTPLVFHVMNLPSPITIGAEAFPSVHVHDTRSPKGTISSETFDLVRTALTSCDLVGADKVLLHSPDGMDDRPHCTGGGIALGRVTLYVARRLLGGKWCHALCVNVY